MRLNVMLMVLGSMVATTFWAAPPTATPPSKEISLTGTFIFTGARTAWEEGEHQLKATLISTGTGEWSAVWNFTWGKNQMTFPGVIKGDLHNGTVTGAGTNPTGSTFVFEGVAKNGTIEFKHFQVTKKGTNKPTGNGKLVVQN